MEINPSIPNIRTFIFGEYNALRKIYNILSEKSGLNSIGCNE